MPGAVIVGIGGVGKVVLMKIRQMIIEEYARLSARPEIQFLHLDTYNRVDNEPGQNFKGIVLGEDVLFKNNERAELSQGMIGGARLTEHPHITQWFPEGLPVDINFELGAGGVRPYGRLAFHYNVDRFRRALNNTLGRASVGATGGPPTLDIFLVSSLFGGTGSGSFLDVAYNIRQVLSDRGLPYRLIGFLVIGGQNPNAGMMANCYAALKELEYYLTGWLWNELKSQEQEKSSGFNQPSAGLNYQPFEVSYPIDGIPRLFSRNAPFDECYLFGAVNSIGVDFDRDALEEATARRIFFELDPGVGNPIRARRVDLEGNPSYYRPERLQKRAKCFFATGLSVIEFPATRVMNALASGLAAYCCHHALFLKASGYPDLRTDVRKFLEDRIKLREISLKRELSKQDSGTIDHAIRMDLKGWQETLTSKIKLSKDQDQYTTEGLLADLRSVVEEAIAAIREGQDQEHTGHYVRTILNNREIIWRRSSPLCQEIINEYVGTAQIGPEHTKSFIENLRVRLKTEKGKYERYLDIVDKDMRARREKVDWRVGRFSTDLSISYRWELQRHVRWLCERELFRFMQRAKEKALNGAVYALLHRCDDQLSRLKGEIELYIERLKMWRKAFLKDMIEIINNILQQWEKESGKGEEAIGLGSREADPLNAFVKELLRKLSKDETLSKDEAWWEEHIGQLYTDFIVPLFQYYNLANPVANIDRSAEDILKKVCNGDLKMVLLPKVIIESEEFRKGLFHECRRVLEVLKTADICKLIQKLDEPSRRKLLNKKKHDAKCMLQVFTQDGTIDHERRRCEQKWVGVWEGLEITTSPIWNDLLDYDSDSERFNTVKEPYRMIIAEEMTVFPLRSVNLVKSYSSAYSSPERDRAGLHTDKRIEFPDLLPPDPKLEKILLRAEKATLVGKMLGILNELEDPRTRFKAIYLTYSHQGERAQVKICDEWGELVDTLMKQQVFKDVDHTYTEITQLERLEQATKETANKAETREEKQVLYELTTNYLDRKRKEIDEKDPYYQRDLEIITEFRNTYRLTR